MDSAKLSVPLGPLVVELLLNLSLEYEYLLCYFIVKKRAGTERVATMLANELVKKHNITIINRDTDYNQSAFKLNEKVTVRKFKGNALSFMLQLKRHVNKSSYNIVCIHNMGRLTPLLTLSTLSKLVVSVEHATLTSRGFWIKNISRLTYLNLDHVIAINSNDEMEFKKLVGENRVTKIFNPSPFNYQPSLTCNETNESSESKIVIAVGRLSFDKNFTSLITAWHLLGDKTKGWELKIYGDGEEKAKLLNLIKKLECENVGLIANVTDMSTVYKSSQFLVMSSRYEGFGMVLVESLSFSKPVISYNCPHGPSDIIQHKVNGLLVEPNNTKKLSEAIGLLIEDKEFRNKLSKKAGESSRPFDIKLIVKQWEDLFGRII